MAQDIVESASRSPIESALKIIILHEVHLMAEAAVVRLLKTFEEPTAHVVFILLADSLVPSLVTVASRCVVVQFGEVSPDIIEAQLISEGIAQATAQSASLGAAGSIERARLLAQDGAYAARRLAFSDVPTSLDGSGSVAFALVDDILQRIEAATVPLEEQHKAEIEELEKRVKATGERGSGRKTLLEAHKRQLRRFRSDELRSGLAVLAGVYRDAMSHAHNAHKTHDYAEAVAHIHTAMHNLGLNANETLLLQSLFLRLPIVRGAELL
jgi:DNA polymerase-3 subunit delta'